MGDDFSTQALMNFDDFTNVDRGLDDTENINTENIETDDSETFHFKTETPETEIIKTEIINTQFNRIINSEKTNTESESSDLDETVMKIEESTQVQDTTPRKISKLNTESSKNSTPKEVANSEISKQLHHFKISSKTFYNIEIIKSENNQVQHTHKHKTETYLGEFFEWPKKLIPDLPDNYVWDFVYPLRGNSTSSKPITEILPQSIQKVKSMKSRSLKSLQKSLDMTCASMMDLPGTPTMNMSRTMNLSQLNLPSTPTCETIVPKDLDNTLLNSTLLNSTLLNNTRATVFGLPDSPTRLENLDFDFKSTSNSPRSITPVPSEILVEFLATQALTENCMVYAKCHDGWIYPAFISDKNPSPGQSKYSAFNNF